jgi:3-hydroxyisobutyrate dehydrogenase-like beta-hydroxyacid dehydrogenase
MAAKLVNQALVGIHAQAACEALKLAERLELTDTKALRDLLNSSWGQSKVLDLVFADYEVAKDSCEKSFDSARKVLGSTASAAPLRNMAKDFLCIEKEIEGTSQFSPGSYF